MHCCLRMGGSYFIANLAEEDGKMWSAPECTRETFDLCKLALGEMDGWDLSLADICILLLRLEPIILTIWF